MRKEDKETIRKAILLMKNECSKHERCKDCKLYLTGKGCIIDAPPQFLDSEAIIAQMEKST